MKYNKIDALLRMKGLKLSDYAKHMNISLQQITNKKKNDTFRADELIMLSDLTNTDLCFVDKDTGNILMRFDASDIKKEPTP